MAYYTQLPALSEVLPASILQDRRFSQFAPYSAVKQEAFEPSLKYDAPSPTWSSYDAPSPGSSNGSSRTPSLSPSPSPRHVQFQQRAYPAPVQGAVWISSTATPGSSNVASPTPSPAAGSSAAHQNLVWMPTNMNLPAPCEPHPQRRSGSTTPTQDGNGKQNYRLVPSDPANADAIVHIAPGGSPQLLIGSAARAQLPKLHAMPEQQRGKIVFYKVVKNA